MIKSLIGTDAETSDKWDEVYLQFSVVCSARWLVGKDLQCLRLMPWSLYGDFIMRMYWVPTSANPWIYLALAIRATSKKSLTRWGRRLSSWSMVITFHRECRGKLEVLFLMNRNLHLGAAHTFCRDRWESFEVPQKSRSPFLDLASLRLIPMRWTFFAALASLLI